MLAGALTVTVMQTNDYFAIGGEGNMIRDMLASYVSKGFHPNWRGVLYGTITMVILITFPRKFKKASLTVRPAFLALVFTLLLNLWLNPSYMPTSIKEIARSAPAAAHFRRDRRGRLRGADHGPYLRRCALASAALPAPWR